MNIEQTILGYLRIATVSPKVYPGEVKKNLGIHKQSILELLDKDPGIKLIVFPELSLTGYTCGDLFLTTDLIRNTQEGISELIEFVKTLNGPVVIFGAPTTGEENSRLYNSAIIVGKSNEPLIINKTNLPSYQEFYESRWFTPGINNSIFEIDGVRVGVEICEDLWVPNPPCEKLVTDYGADIIVNLSASPKLAGKYNYLKDLVKITSGRLLCSYVYVSSGPWESSTDLVFSGWSVVYENANKIAELKPIKSLLEETRYLITDIDIHEIRGARRKNKIKTSLKPSNFIIDNVEDEKLERSPYRNYISHPFLVEENYDDIFTVQSLGLQKRIMSCGGENCRLIIGISGGTDSTLALLVAVDAIDKLGFPRTNIIGVTLPCFGTTSKTKDNSLRLMKLLKIDGREINIKESVTAHLKELGHPLDLYDIAYENAQARMRTQVLFNLSNMEGGLVLGTGDLSELAVGWCTFGADHLSSYNPNASIPKTLVKELLRWKSIELKDLSEVLNDILGTPVSPELLPPSDSGEIAQVSENNVGPYELIDYFFYHFLRTGMNTTKIGYTCFWAFSGKYSLQEIQKWERKFISRFGNQQFKRSCLPDGPKTGNISLSPRGDWRMPSDINLTEYDKF